MSNSKKISGSGGIRTHASEETGALNQRLRPLGHATLLLGEQRNYLQKAALDILSFPTDWKLFSSGHVRGKYRKILKCCCQKWDLNPRPHTRTRNLYTTPYHRSTAVYLESGATRPSWENLEKYHFFLTRGRLQFVLLYMLKACQITNMFLFCIHSDILPPAVVCQYKLEYMSQWLLSSVG